jgi:hypothetical protein
MRLAGHVAHIGEMRNAYKSLVIKSEWKRLFGRPRCGWENNIKVSVEELGWEVVSWIHLTQDRY